MQVGARALALSLAPGYTALIFLTVFGLQRCCSAPTISFDLGLTDRRGVLRGAGLSEEAAEETGGLTGVSSRDVSSRDVCVCLPLGASMLSL